jgi:hypothetical protein
MFRKRYWQERLDELKENFNFRQEEVQELKKSLQIEDWTPKQRLRLKRQIQDAERELQEVAQEIAALEKSANSEQLYKVLLRLGYQRQARLFIRLVQAQSVSSFLIHGSPEYGQRWLLNRLVGQYVPDSINGKVVKVDLARKGRQSNINALWRELGDHFYLGGKQVSPGEIASRVYQCWQSQNVLFVFHNVDYMPQPYLEQLVRDFWQPLAKRARQAGTGTSEFQLLMFLVDYEGSVGNLDALFSDNIDPAKPHPVKPPKINQFTERDLLDWISVCEFAELPIELTHDVDDTVRAILDESDGIPEDVLRGIFRRCGYSYQEEVEQKWRL